MLDMLASRVHLDTHLDGLIRAFCPTESSYLRRLQIVGVHILCCLDNTYEADEYQETASALPM